MGSLKVICCALIFIMRIRLLPGKSLVITYNNAIIQHQRQFKKYTLLMMKSNMNIILKEAMQERLVMFDTVLSNTAVKLYPPRLPCLYFLPH